MSLPPLASATSLTANWPGWLHANPPSATWCNSTGSRGVTGRSPVDTTAEAHQRFVSLREPSASSMRYLGTAIRHRSRSSARGLVCQPSGSRPGGLASWTSATDTPCSITSELRCCQDAGPLCMFQEATVSMAAFSQTASPRGQRRQFGTMICPELPLTARAALDGSATTVSAWLHVRGARSVTSADRNSRLAPARSPGRRRRGGAIPAESRRLRPVCRPPTGPGPVPGGCLALRERAERRQGLRRLVLLCPVRRLALPGPVARNAGLRPVEVWQVPSRRAALLRQTRRSSRALAPGRTRCRLDRSHPALSHRPKDSLGEGAGGQGSRAD